MMLSFRTYCNHPDQISMLEGAINPEDIFKRENRKRFIEKSVAGELVDTKGNKIPKIDPNSKLIDYLKTTTKRTPEINDLIKAAFGKSLTALSIDKPANGFARGQGKKEPSGAQWEELICVAYNMASKKVDRAAAQQLAGLSEWPEWYNDYLVPAQNIVKEAFGNSANGVMKHFGASSAELTEQWNRYFIQTTGKPASGTTKTPKTDMFIGNMHISLKKAGGSQLMSGGKAETLATLAAAYENIPESVKTKHLETAWSKLMSTIERDFIKVDLPAGKSIGSFKTDTDIDDEDEVTKTVVNALRNQKVMTETIRSILELPEAKMEVVREAMTGQKKFADEIARATHIMVFDPEGGGKYKRVDNAVVSQYARVTDFNISFKSSGVGGASWTALKGIVKEDVELSNDILKSIISETYRECKIEFMTENIFSRAGKAIKRGIEVTKVFINRFMTKLWGKLKGMIVGSFDAMQRILGIQMTASNPIVHF
jgi:hypothetical protein